MWILLLNVLAGCLLLGVVLHYVLPTAITVFQLIRATYRCFHAKADFPPVVSVPTEPWDEPLSREELMESLQSTTGNHTHKILWGYWHEASLPGFCQLAVQSWKVHHPDWHIVIVTHDNFQQYVSHSDLPSTFDSLKVQFQSDLIRAAVLKRYGGIYLDMTYVLFKSLDDVWDQAAQQNDIYLTSLWTLDVAKLRPKKKKRLHYCKDSKTNNKRQDVVLPNICLMIAPTPNNPLLCAWQQSLLTYYENPTPHFTMAEMKQHSHLQRITHLLDHPSLGPFIHMSPYFISLWLLLDTLYYSDDAYLQAYVKEHVSILPSLLWTELNMMTQLFTIQDSDDIYAKALTQESFVVWLRRFPHALQFYQGSCARAAEKFCRHVNAAKLSSDFCFDFEAPPDYHLSLTTTQGRIWRTAVDENAPRVQATTRGAYRITPLATCRSTTTSRSAVEDDVTTDEDDTTEEQPCGSDDARENTLDCSNVGRDVEVAAPVNFAKKNHKPFPTDGQDVELPSVLRCY